MTNVKIFAQTEEQLNEILEGFFNTMMVLVSLGRIPTRWDYDHPENGRTWQWNEDKTIVDFAPIANNYKAIVRNRDETSIELQFLIRYRPEARYKAIITILDAFYSDHYQMMPD